MRVNGAVVIVLASCVLGGVGAAAGEAPAVDGSNSDVPDWAADAIWYQILVSRFCNGSRENDLPGTRPWTADWAQLEPGESPPLRERLFFRRYGGDLQGLQSKLPYLRDLGVNTLYLNPIFQGASEHKYDTADHRHVDDSYGIAASRRRLSGETEHPDTWQWSDSDRVFLEFLAAAHRDGFRVVLDGVFSHAGQEFWAWQDVRANGRRSRYAHWFDVTHWGPPMQWRAWDRANGDLPNFRRQGDGLDPDIEAYLFAVVRRWMDPDRDGDPSDGIDGWRLDAAETVPPGFWRRLRRVVKSVNPDAILVGEIWTDAGAWLGGDQFDSVTNYRFSDPLVQFFKQGDGGVAPSALAEELAALRDAHPWPTTLAMLNLFGSHDTERAVTMLVDPVRYRPSSGGVPGRIPRRDTLRPDEDAFRRMKLAALLQFTYAGAPVIYYGDEVGMYGGDDPFCRAPMWWPETCPPDYRTDLLHFYQALCHLRRQHVELRRGRVHWVLADDARRLLAFSRRYQGRETVVVINGDTRFHAPVLAMGHPSLPLKIVKVFTNSDPLPPAGRDHERVGSAGLFQAECPGLSGQVLRLDLEMP
jgi:cyclomaltodextrinase